jgi:hypothetical protein
MVLRDTQRDELAPSQSGEHRVEERFGMQRHQALRKTHCVPQARLQPRLQPHLNPNERVHLPLLLVFFFRSRIVLLRAVGGHVSEKPPTASTWSCVMSPAA